MEAISFFFSVFQKLLNLEWLSVTLRVKNSNSPCSFNSKSPPCGFTCPPTPALFFFFFNLSGINSYQSSTLFSCLSFSRLRVIVPVFLLPGIVPILPDYLVIYLLEVCFNFSSEKAFLTLGSSDSFYCLQNIVYLFFPIVIIYFKVCLF